VVANPSRVVFPRFRSAMAGRPRTHVDAVLPLLLMHDIRRTTEAENAIALLRGPPDNGQDLDELEQDAGLFSSDEETSDDL
jgi:hypothetical protein